MTLEIPLDGRLTSQNILAAPLSGGEVMEIVSPGNAANGNTYQVTIDVIAAYCAAFAILNTEVITSGATSLDPYDVEDTDTRILFNKTVGAASYALLPLAEDMLYGQPVLFKDLKGDAATNVITITFTGGELCDGLSSLEISSAYGYLTIAPVPGGGSWYVC